MGFDSRISLWQYLFLLLIESFEIPRLGDRELLCRHPKFEQLGDDGRETDMTVS
jgi:hypothetical protein